MNTNKKTARIAGFLYLIYMVTRSLRNVSRTKLIVFGDAMATARNIWLLMAIPHRFYESISRRCSFPFDGLGFIRVIKTGK